MSKLGFIGAGNHARHHVAVFCDLPGVEKGWIYDRDKTAASQAAEDFDYIDAVASADAIFSNREVDGVIIAVPAEFHRDYLEKALVAGKHVLIEKPLADTVGAARAMVERARAFPGQVVLVGHCERFNPAYLDVRKACEEGHLGEVRFLSASRLSPLHLNDPSWELGVLDTAVHDIDLMLWYAGAPAVEVAAHGVRVNPALSIPDHVVYLIRFENGALAEGHIGWIPFGEAYPLSGNAHPRLLVTGTKGVAQLDLWRRPVRVHQFEENRLFDPDSVVVGYGDYFTVVKAQNYAWLRAITEGKPLPIQIGEAAEAVAVAHAASLSLHEREGQFVRLDYP